MEQLFYFIISELVVILSNYSKKIFILLLEIFFLRQNDSAVCHSECSEAK